MMDPRNRNRVDSNLPEDEIKALKELIKLQREPKIVIKACDKGAGIIILNFEDFLKAFCEDLNSDQIQKDWTPKPYYTRVDEF